MYIFYVYIYIRVTVQAPVSAHQHLPPSAAVRLRDPPLSVAQQPEGALHQALSEPRHLRSRDDLASDGQAEHPQRGAQPQD